LGIDKHKIHQNNINLSAVWVVLTMNPFSVMTNTHTIIETDDHATSIQPTWIDVCSSLFEAWVLELVFCYNRIYLAIFKRVNYLQNNYVDEMGQRVQRLWKRLVYSHIEPDGNWVYSGALVENPGIGSARPTYQLLENYHDSDASEYSGKTQIDAQYALAQNTLTTHSQIAEILLIARHTESDSYFVRSCVSAYGEIPPITPREESEVEFLGIEYRHPKMSAPISLSLPKSMCIVGNELFSAAFVLRCLQYEPLWTSFVFDKDYLLTIMDDNIHQYTLHSNEYIVLEKEHLRVCRSDEPLSPKIDGQSEYLHKFEKMYL